MSAARLSPLDASFLAIESPTAHMHVGWIALCAAPAEGPVPSFRDLRDHIGARLGRAPRYRQKLAPVPLALRAAEWVDDERFSLDRHVYPASGPLRDLVDEVMSMPLRRDRPLWEMWICHEIDEAGFAIVCKAHHCMVDGLAAVELGSLLFDPTPEIGVCRRNRWHARPRPRAEWLLARGVWELAGESVALATRPLRALATPRRTFRQTLAGTVRLTKALNQSMQAAPACALNAPLSPGRRVAWVERPFADLRAIRHAYGGTINDVILAAVAGALRAHLISHGERPVALKVMVPVNVRSAGDVLGNHLSFVFTELPCDQADPLTRLHQVQAAMNRRKRDGAAQGAQIALRLASHTPVALQHAVSRLVASPRTFNLAVSNIPGPGEQLYLRGSPLLSVFPVVPLADGHAVSVGMTTIHDRACFGIYADGEAVTDVDTLARSVDDAITELLVCVRGPLTPRRQTGTPALLGRRPRAASGPPSTRHLAAVPEPRRC
jgi:WS/DGAT/MGAT family acyltransferase